MKSYNATIIFLACLIVLGLAQIPFQGDPPYSYTLASGNKPSPIDIRVPPSDNANLKEIGYSFWLRGKYSSPEFFKFNHLHSNWPSIAGIVDNKFGHCSTAQRHRFLALWLRHSGQGDPAYHFTTYQKNNGNPAQNMIFPGNRDDFDHSWNLISFSYSFERQKAVAVVHFGVSGQYKVLEWMNNDKHTPQALKFRIGGCNDNTGITFQGDYHDVRFQWSTETGSGILIETPEQLHQFAQSRLAPNTPPIEPIVHNVQNGILTRRFGENNINKWNFNNLNGVKEYAVWGWCKWDYTRNKKSWHNIYRFSGLSEGKVQNANKIGDRTLTAWVGNGYIHFSTYNFQWHGGHQTNLPQNVNYDGDLMNWFFLYQGYSYELKKTVAYVKFASKEQTLQWENDWHMLPDEATFYLGKDQFYHPFNGDLKNWNVAFGEGAYREDNFQDLYEQTNFVGQDEIDLEEPQDPEPQLYEKAHNVKIPAVLYEVPQEELQDIQDTSYSFWFRYNFFSPEGFNYGPFVNQWQAFASLSENDKCSAGVNDRWQSIWFQHMNVGTPTLHFTTYAQNLNNWNRWQNMQFQDADDLDSAWNFLYFGYSHRKQTLFAYVKFGRSGNVQTLSWDQSTHTNPPGRLVFRLGACNQYNFSFNGHFWNPRFYYKGDSYLGSKEAVDRYFESSTKPQLFPKVQRLITIPLVQEQREFTSDKANALSIGPIDGVEGAEEYAVYGWAKWNFMTGKQPWHILFRSTNFDEDSYENANFASRDQVCWIGNGYLHFSNYQFNYNGAGNNWNWYQNIDYQDDLQTWFWFYQGYSFTQKKTFVYVQFHNDRVETKVWNNNNHALPFKPTIHVGHDKFYPGFNGDMKNVNAIYGPGAYKENNFQDLKGDRLIEDQFDEDNFWQEEPAIENSAFDNGPTMDWEAYEVPEEELPNIKEYSFSAYVKFSMTNPYRMGINIPKTTWRGIMGITEQDEYCTHNQPGYRTLGLWDSFWNRAGSPSYHFTTYATNKNNNNIHKDMPINVEDIDGSWNWIYFGYSLEEQNAFALVKFGRSQEVRTLSWQQVVHNDNLTKLKFLLGNCGQRNQKGFHGQYYDVRFRYDNMAFKRNEEHALHYLHNHVPANPLRLRPKNIVDLTDGQESHDMNEELGQNFEYADQFAGSEEYAVWGWAKWQNPPSRTTWHLLFRVTINEEGNNVSNLGDRTLSVWIGNGIIHFTTYRFTYSGQRVVNSVKNINYQDDLTSWFFIYYGYNWRENKAYGYVKFQDRTEVVTFEGHRHMLPKYFRVYLAKDPWHKAFNGQMRGFKFCTGEECYREGNFEEIMQYERENIDTDDVSRLVPQSNSLLEPHQESILGEFSIFEQEELDQIQAYQVSSWTKWSFRSPEFFGKVNAWKGKCYPLIRAVAEQGKGLQVHLCVKNSKQVFYRFWDTYQSNAKAEIIVDQPIQQVIDQWVFVYYAHSQQLGENQYYLFFASNGQGQGSLQASTAQPDSYQRFNFKLGGRQQDQTPFNGFFYNTQFNYGENQVYLTEQQVQDLAQEEWRQLPKHNSDDLDNRPIFIPVKNQNVFSVSQDSNPDDSKRVIRDYEQVDEYSVFGWTKLYQNNYVQQSPWTFLFRLTINEPDHLHDVNKVGDRTLCVWLHSSLQMVWISYDLNFPQNDNINLHQFNAGAPRFTMDQLTQGFFFTYFGYSPVKEKLFFYVQFSDGTEHEIPVEGVNHLKSSYFAFHLGIDYNGVTTYRAFDGKFMHWNIGLGRGSFSDDVADMEIFKQIATEQGYIDEEPTNADPQEGDELGDGNDNENDLGDGINEPDNTDPDLCVADLEESDDQVDENEQLEEEVQGVGIFDVVPNQIDEETNPENQDQDQDQDQDDEYDTDDDEDDGPPAPEGDCVILYSECDFQGDWEEICDRSPKIYIDVKSVYVPEGLRIKLYNLPHFEGKTAIFHQTVNCIDNIDFQFLQKYGIKIVNQKKKNMLQPNLKKVQKNFVQATIIRKQ